MPQQLKKHCDEERRNHINRLDLFIAREMAGLAQLS